MTIVSIEDAQANLKELIHQLSPGEELIITENQQTVTKLVSHVSMKPKLRSVPGLGKGIITIVSDDDEPDQTELGNAKAVVAKPALTSWPCQPGTAKDSNHWMAPDFDAPPAIAEKVKC
jgi:antitoxin (DNA-binding transcriptional repressor) of toxin-antitoxin stability system